jgi:hypothetical protein
MPCWGILLTKAKLDNEEDEDRTFIVLSNDKKKRRINASRARTINTKCHIDQLMIWVAY